MRPVVLSGPPGSGKSTAAPRVAALLGARWTDLDREVEARAGTKLPELFARHGESRFRAIEADVLMDLVKGRDVVIAAGGGSLIQRTLRREVLRQAHVVGLTASLDVLASRLASDAPRPLLAGAVDPLRALGELIEARAEGYAEAHVAIDTTARDPDAVAEVIARALRHEAVLVPLGARSYPVITAPLQHLGEVMANLPGRPPRHLVVVTDANVWRAWGPRLIEAIGTTPEALIVLRPGERSKTLASVRRVWNAALDLPVDRDAVVLAVGGGVVTDIAGFAAATLLRGLRLVSVPTSLLAMVDASVGGKTGIDLGQGKNLVGAFHQPSAVLVDPSVLATLPHAEFTSALAEVVKIGLVRDPELFTMVERESTALGRGGEAAGELLRAVIRASIQAKADVVAEDERDLGARATLNFGHTIGHALEAASGYRLRHGDCVAIGMRGALMLGHRLGLTSRDLQRRVGELLQRLGLPDRARLPYQHVKSLLFADKKRSREGLRFVLVESPGRAVVRVVPTSEAFRSLRDVLDAR